MTADDGGKFIRDLLREPPDVPRLLRRMRRQAFATIASVLQGTRPGDDDRTLPLRRKECRRRRDGHRTSEERDRRTVRREKRLGWRIHLPCRRTPRLRPHACPERIADGARTVAVGPADHETLRPRRIVIRLVRIEVKRALQARARPTNDPKGLERPPHAAMIEEVHHCGQKIAKAEKPAARKPRNDAQGDADAEPLKRHPQRSLESFRLA